MAISLTSPVTGSAQTGLTAPTFTVVSDASIPSNGKQWMVTALGGTQTGVLPHSISSPFTVSVFRPAVLKVLGIANPTTGLVAGSIPKNKYSVLVRKGVKVNATQTSQMQFLAHLDIPAGADTEDLLSVRAAISAAIGALNQLSVGLGEMAANGGM